MLARVALARDGAFLLEAAVLTVNGERDGAAETFEAALGRG